MSSDVPEPTDVDAARIDTARIEDEMEQSYIDYAMSVIAGRALPDVRDGLKPVHRRILYAMHEEGVTSGSSHRKSSSIVGETMGNFHPHGDSPIYDAMVRMAQDFSMRYPLVDGQGNFGSVDGDPPAAMRYTEARMAPIAEELLSDIDMDTVDFSANYDDRLQEPDVLPAAFPNLLVNGSSGIAVGMSTNIPPHNLGEIIDATIELIDNPDATVEDLMDHVKGPDFPTGANIVGHNAVHAAYKTGRGRIRVRAEYEVEERENGSDRIVITELPYQTNKARMVEKIADAVNDGAIEGIRDLRDESDRDGIRIVVELKRNAMAEVVKNQLLESFLEKTFGVINLALVDGQPQVLTLKETLQHYLDHRKEVVRRRSEYELGQKQAELLSVIEEELLAIKDEYDDDRRTSFIEDTDEVTREDLIAEEDVVVVVTEQDYVKRMPVSQFDAQNRGGKGIIGGDIKEGDRVSKAFRANTHDYLLCFTNQGQVYRLKTYEIPEMSRTARGKSAINLLDLDDGEEITAVVNTDDFEDEECLSMVTRDGYVKRTAASEFDNILSTGIIAAKLEDGDELVDVKVTNGSTDLLVATREGMAIRFDEDEAREMGRNARGVRGVDLEGEDTVAGMVAVEDDTEQDLLTVTENGYGKRTPLTEYRKQSRNGKGLVDIKTGDRNGRVTSVKAVGPADHLVIMSESGQIMRIRAADISEVGRNTMGVKVMELEGDDGVATVDVIPDANGGDAAETDESEK